ncbi:MAG: ATP-binding cassette domain-containing protein, partial [Thermoleophilia bacterium]|nr:ATP-binding cassette domain-containing protein [Thermoleophilia bacterium]
MTRLNVDGLVKRIDRVAVVDGASLDIAAGELAVVVGPSGAGKTTLARLIVGLDRPDAGEIFFDARVVHTLPPQDRKVGPVFQEDGLWPGMTVAENLGYALRLSRVPRAEHKERVAEALNALRIDTLAARRPDELTGLQRRRAALARALAVRPALLVLDEPMGPLESRVRDDLRDDIRRIHAETGLTTLVLTSDPR